jgi:hypothetical protein
MTQIQTNRLIRKASLTLIQQGWTPDLDDVRRTVHSHLRKYAKSKGEGQTKSEMAAEITKELILSMDTLNHPDILTYHYQKLFNQIYRDLSVDDKKAQKTRP